MALLPPIGTSGIFQLAAPFNNQLQSNMSYRCDAIRRFNDLLDSPVSIDPYEEFYLPNNITREKYEQDAQNLTSIVSLVSSAGHVVYVPSSYITGYPDINGIPYHVVVLGLELGALPQYKDLTGLKQAIANLVRDTIGVYPQMKEVVISAEERLSQADHDVAENARALMIVNSQTDRARLLALQTQHAALQNQYQQLSDYVRALPPA
jgi:hypothetical protein